MRHPHSDSAVIDRIVNEDSMAEEPRPIVRALTSSRRAFLSRGVVAAGTAGVLGGSKLASAATTPPFPTYYPGSTESKFQGIQVDEYDHVNFLAATIVSLGGTPRPLPTFTGITGLSATQFLTLAKTFENTGVGAYPGAAPFISNPAIAKAATQIALVEAYHAGWLNTLANDPLVPHSSFLAIELELPTVLNAIAPFVQSLNDNGAFPPVYGSTPSAANDIAILNFALLLEMLEAEFYYFNVVKFYPK